MLYSVPVCTVLVFVLVQGTRDDARRRHRSLGYHPCFVCTTVPLLRLRTLPPPVPGGQIKGSKKFRSSTHVDGIWYKGQNSLLFASESDCKSAVSSHCSLSLKKRITRRKKGWFLNQSPQVSPSLQVIRTGTRLSSVHKKSVTSGFSERKVCYLEFLFAAVLYSYGP